MYHRSYLQHAPRDVGEAAAPMPVHKAIAKAAYAPDKEAAAPIKTFQFLDDGAWAKVYLPLENLSRIRKEDIEASFEPRSFTVIVRNLQKWPLEFTVAKTHGEIEPEQCTAKLLKSKILVKLRKAPQPPKTEESQELDADADSEPPGLDAEAAEEPPETFAEMPADADRLGADVPADLSQASDAAAAVDLSAGAGEVAPSGEGAAAATAAPASVTNPSEAIAETVDTTQNEHGTFTEGTTAPGADDAAQDGATTTAPKVQHAHWYKLRADG